MSDCGHSEKYFLSFLQWTGHSVAVWLRVKGRTWPVKTVNPAINHTPGVLFILLNLTDTDLGVLFLTYFFMNVGCMTLNFYFYS